MSVLQNDPSLDAMILGLSPQQQQDLHRAQSQQRQQQQLPSWLPSWVQDRVRAQQAMPGAGGPGAPGGLPGAPQATGASALSAALADPMSAHPGSGAGDKMPQSVGAPQLKGPLNAADPTDPNLGLVLNKQPMLEDMPVRPFDRFDLQTAAFRGNLPSEILSNSAGRFAPLQMMQQANAQYDQNEQAKMAAQTQLAESGDRSYQELLKTMLGQQQHGADLAAHMSDAEKERALKTDLAGQQNKIEQGKLDLEKEKLADTKPQAKLQQLLLGGFQSGAIKDAPGARLLLGQLKPLLDETAPRGQAPAAGGGTAGSAGSGTSSGGSAGGSALSDPGDELHRAMGQVGDEIQQEASREDKDKVPIYQSAGDFLEHVADKYGGDFVATHAASLVPFVQRKFGGKSLAEYVNPGMITRGLNEFSDPGSNDPRSILQQYREDVLKSPSTSDKVKTALRNYLKGKGQFEGGRFKP